jgi:hypothetical protein
MSREPNDLLRAFGSRYLSLIRENYLDDEEDIRPFVHDFASSCSESEIERLLCADDWRLVVVGVFAVIGGERHHFGERLEKLLLEPTVRLARRPATLALALGEEKSGRSAMRAFLEGPYEPDALDEYCGVLEAVEQCSGLDADVKKRILSHMLKDGFSENEIKSSRRRFAEAVRFWQGIHSR